MDQAQRANARFSAGDVVRIDDRPALGHCRTPWYLRGHVGVVAEVLGQFRDPERLAYHRPGLPALVLYKVRFRQRDIWPSYPGPAADTLEADIYEPWLAAALTPTPPPRERGSKA
jgi:nitrile hydratase